MCVFWRLSGEQEMEHLTDKLGEGDAAEHGGAHFHERSGSACRPRARGDHKCVHQVRAELDRDAQRHGQVDQGHRVQLDAPHHHHSQQVYLPPHPLSVLYSHSPDFSRLQLCQTCNLKQKMKLQHYQQSTVPHCAFGNSNRPAM